MNTRPVFTRTRSEHGAGDGTTPQNNPGTITRAHHSFQPLHWAQIFGAGGEQTEPNRRKSYLVMRIPPANTTDPLKWIRRAGCQDFPDPKKTERLVPGSPVFSGVGILNVSLCNCGHPAESDLLNHIPSRRGNHACLLDSVPFPFSRPHKTGPGVGMCGGGRDGRGVSGGKRPHCGAVRDCQPPGAAGFWSSGGVIHGLAERRQTQSCVKILQTQLPAATDQRFGTQKYLRRIL